MDPAEKLQEQESSMRDDLESAISNIEGDEDREESVSMDGLLPDGEKPEEKQDENAQEVSEEKPDGEDVQQQATDEQKPDEPKAPEGEDASKKGIKAPQSWTPKAREQWSKVPRDIQEVITAREKEVNTVLQQTAQSREVHQFIDGLAKSYAPIMAAENVDNPLVAIQGLFKTVSELRMGSPEQKAMKMANLIQHYGIDIQALDGALSGQAVQPSQSTQLESLIEQKMQPVNHLLTELQQRQASVQQQTAADAERAVNEFQGEFLADVRNDMADLIDMAAARGQEMTLQDAYDKAILLRPEIQAVLKERQQNADLLSNQEKLGQKQQAASSVSGSPAGGGGALGGEDSLRATIEGAWEQQSEKI